jgi:hypothetical protein
MATFSATLGDVVRIGKAPTPILIKDVSGNLVDPTTITVTALRPDGTMASPPPTAVHESLGTYHVDYEPPVERTMAGLHRIRIVTAGPDAAFELAIWIDPSPFAP